MQQSNHQSLPFDFRVSLELIKTLKKLSFDLVSNGGNKPSTPFYPIGEEAAGKLIFKDQISFGTVSPKDESGKTVFKGKIKIKHPHNNHIEQYVVGELNFKTGLGSYSFCKR